MNNGERIKDKTIIIQANIKLINMINGKISQLNESIK